MPTQSHRHSWLAACLAGLLLFSPALPSLAAAAASADGSKSAPSSETQAARRKLIDEETAGLAAARNALEASRAEFEKLRSELASTPVTAAMVEDARISSEAAALELESSNLDRVAAERSRDDLNAAIQTQEDALKALQAGKGAGLTGAKRDKAIAAGEATLAEKKALLELETQHLNNLVERHNLAQARSNLAQERFGLLQEQFQVQQESQRRVALDDLDQHLRAEQEKLLAQAADLRDQLHRLAGDDTATQSQRHLLESQIKNAEESAYLLRVRLTRERARVALAQLGQLPPDPALDADVLNKALQTVDTTLADLTSVTNLTQRKQDLLHQELAVIEKRQALDGTGREQNRRARAIIEKLIKRFDKELAELGPLLTQVQESQAALEKAHSESVRRGLGTRHELPADAVTWNQLLGEAMALPKTLGKALAETATGLWAALVQADLNRWSILVVLALAWSALALPLRRLPPPSAGKLTAANSFSARTWLVAKALIRANRIGVMAGGALLLLAWVAQPAPPATALITLAVCLWLGARLVIGLARWFLDSPLVETKQRLPAFHRTLTRVTVVGAVASGIVALGHLDFYSTLLRDVIDRAFMLVLLPVAYVTLQTRGMLLVAVERHAVRPHWLQILRLVTLVVPFSILAAALLGLVGYINMAWYVAAHMALFLVVLSGWLALRAVLRDLNNTLKNYVTTHSPRGLAWALGVVDPLHQLTRIALFFTALWALLRLYGWNGDSAFAVTLKGWLHQPLVTVGQVSLDLQHLLGSALFLVAVIWLARHVKQFTYRWLFGSIGDLGVRNSLAVLSQYALVLVGVLVALKALGIDLTSIAIFAGALGVGIGFGLQSIANNFISGIIMLVERPLRVRDWVTIGSSEGEVTRIGSRSVTVTTWDNQDVIIPNADITGAAFTNWTHTDNLVRTVIKLGVSYHDDPHQAQAVIEAAVRSHPAVSKHHAPEVWLSQFGASSVDFWVQYFTDIRRHPRYQIKSEVLFAIWDALKEARINIPFPQQEVYIKELPASMGERPAAPQPGVVATELAVERAGNH